MLSNNQTLMRSVSFVTRYASQAMQSSFDTYIMLSHIDFYRRSSIIEL
jgi:hypothetical protein